MPKKFKDLTERVWAKANRSPFEDHNEKEELPEPPANWKKSMERMINSAVLSKLAEMEREIERNQSGG
jgi:hypothetical protein